MVLLELLEWLFLLQNYKGSWVPNIVMGGGNGSQAAGSGAQELINLLTAKTAQELGFGYQYAAKTSACRSGEPIRDGRDRPQS
jgi:hypothetical protein